MTSMETSDAKGWKPHGYQPPSARSAGKRHEVIPGFSHPFPAPLTLLAGLDAGAASPLVYSPQLMPAGL